METKQVQTEEELPQMIQDLSQRRVSVDFPDVPNEEKMQIDSIPFESHDQHVEDEEMPLPVMPVTLQHSSEQKVIESIKQ